VTVVRADQVQLGHAGLAVREGELDAQPRSTVVRGDEADVGRGGRAESDQPAAREPGLRQHARIVGVRHRGRGLAQRVE